MTKQQLQIDYQVSVNRVFQHIEENLASELSLKALSQVAFFSPFHFHRIFKIMTGETLNEYVTRRRIERSALDLLHKQSGVTAIALRYGFNSNSAFTRAFKQFYGVSPTAFRQQNPHRFSKIRQLESKNSKAYPDTEKYICAIDNLKNWIGMNAQIEIRELPKMDLAYVTAIGPHNIEEAYGKIVRWATPRGLLNGATKMVTIYHDSFKVTEPEKVRMSACMLLNNPVATDGEIGLRSIEATKCIVGSFEIKPHEFEKSWTGLFVWMNEHGYRKAETNPFEIHHNNFHEHPENKAIVDLCIPVC